MGHCKIAVHLLTRRNLLPSVWHSSPPFIKRSRRICLLYLLFFLCLFFFFFFGQAPWEIDFPACLSRYLHHHLILLEPYLPTRSWPVGKCTAFLPEGFQKAPKFMTFVTRRDTIPTPSRTRSSIILAAARQLRSTAAIDRPSFRCRFSRRSRR